MKILIGKIAGGVLIVVLGIFIVNMAIEIVKVLKERRKRTANDQNTNAQKEKEQPLETKND